MGRPAGPPFPPALPGRLRLHLRNVGLAVGADAEVEESGRGAERRVPTDPRYPAYKAFLALALFPSGERAAALSTMLDALLDAEDGASLVAYERALADYQREPLDRAVAGRQVAE